MAEWFSKTRAGPNHPLVPEGMRVAVAKYYLDKYLRAKRGVKLPNGADAPLPKWELPSLEDAKKTHGPGGDFTGNVCIIGAGAAGLYIAMMLKYLGITNVDILEASDDVGGRCYTYGPFSDGTACGHDYYDVGAMRIPNIDAMKSCVDALGFFCTPFLLTFFQHAKSRHFNPTAEHLLEPCRLRLPR
jgi:hypothetical protein